MRFMKGSTIRRSRHYPCFSTMLYRPVGCFVRLELFMPWRGTSNGSSRGVKLIGLVTGRADFNGLQCGTQVCKRSGEGVVMVHLINRDTGSDLSEVAGALGFLAGFHGSVNDILP